MPRVRALLLPVAWLGRNCRGGGDWLPLSSFSVATLNIVSQVVSIRYNVSLQETVRILYILIRMISLSRVRLFVMIVLLTSLRHFVGVLAARALGRISKDYTCSCYLVLTFYNLVQSLSFGLLICLLLFKQRLAGSFFVCFLFCCSVAASLAVTTTTTTAWGSGLQVFPFRCWIFCNSKNIQSFLASESRKFLWKQETFPHSTLNNND